MRGVWSQSLPFEGEVWRGRTLNPKSGGVWVVQGWVLTTYRGERLGCVLTPSELFRMDPLNPKVRAEPPLPILGRRGPQG